MTEPDATTRNERIDAARARLAAVREEFPFAPSTLDLGEVKYAFLDEGAGEPLLFVHGNPTWSFAWRKFVADLSRDHRCVAVDHVGCGLSDKPQDYPYRLANHIANLERLVERLDLRDVTLVAHDWGGAIGLGVAGRHPERFKRLVLMNTGAFRSDRMPRRIAVCRWPVVGPIAVRGFNAFARAAITMAVEKPERMTTAVRDGYLFPYASWADRVAIQRFVEDIPLAPSHPSYGTLVEVETNLARLADKPTLLAWGMKDWCFTPAFLEEFERRFPRAESLRLDDAGHYVFEDAWERIIPRMREFLAKHP